MGNPKCGKCGKTVYPMELVTAAKQSWHKFCFKCAQCSTTLNLKNFKAHDDKVWCAVHYPPAQTKVTSFENDRQADSGTFENAASESAAAAGGGWGGGTPDSGEFVREGQGYDQGAAAGGYEGGYEEGYGEEAYGEEAYGEEGYGEEGYGEEGYYEEEGYGGEY